MQGGPLADRFAKKAQMDARLTEMGINPETLPEQVYLKLLELHESPEPFKIDARQIEFLRKIQESQPVLKPIQAD